MRPSLHAIDWTFIALYCVFAVALGSIFARQAGTSISSFFVGDRKLPWWIAGTSIVATTFAADTPLVVTGLVASGGISHNWIWWCWGIAHLTATFLFARMWRRSAVITDAEITEVRYGGKPAAALRAFKAVYNGVFINCLTMAWVIAAMVKISRAFFDVEPWLVILICVSLSVLYTCLGGFRSVVVTDLVQFALGMGGAVALAIIVVNAYGGVGHALPDGGGTGLLGSLSTATAAAGKSLSSVLDFIPATDHPKIPLVYFAVLLIAGWWRYAEGNGYIVQRLAACKDEGHAQGASLWFAVAHNALRPWPWILVGLAALVLYPLQSGEVENELRAPGFSDHQAIIVEPGIVDVATGGSITLTGVAVGDTVRLLEQVVAIEPDGDRLVARFEPFEHTTISALSITQASTGAVRRVEGMRVALRDREMGYPLMMGRYLPTGLLGLVIASLLAAFMSTIDTHTNWGASYLVQDIYKRFLRPNASQPHYVWVSRGCIVLMGILAGLSALIIDNIGDVWKFLIALGAGLGSVTAARWYWSRVTPHAEFAALGVTTFLALGLQLFFAETIFGRANSMLVYPIAEWTRIIIIAGGSLAVWVPVALFGPRNDPEVLRRFAERVRPPGPGWRQWRKDAPESLRPALLRLAAGGVVVYGTLFGIGNILIGSGWLGVLLIGTAALLLAWIILRESSAPT